MSVRSAVSGIKCPDDYSRFCYNFIKYRDYCLEVLHNYCALNSTANRSNYESNRKIYQQIIDLTREKFHGILMGFEFTSVPIPQS